LNRRYRLLPHYYTLFYKTHTTGVPVMTPVFFAGMSMCNTDDLSFA
jgi:alpha-glucosidase (family GH31 glycosyl hydrolase)